MGDHTPPTEKSQTDHHTPSQHPSTGNSQTNPSILADLTSSISQILRQATTSTIHEPVAAPIGIKLDGTNYGIWSQVVEMYISAKDKLGYINEDLQQPLEADPNFRKWRTENSVVKSWLINSLDPKLIGNYIRFSNSKGGMGCYCYNIFRRH